VFGTSSIDLIFSNTGELVNKIDYKSIEFVKDTEVSSGVDHVGIYLGENKVIHCTDKNNSGVIIENISDSINFNNIVGYGRIADVEEKRYVISVPDERIDIRIKEDLIEEIARVYGYDNIKTNEVKRDSDRIIDKTHYYSLEFSDFLLSLGYTDVMTYTLRDKGDFEISNPLTKDKGFLRNNLIDGLKESLELNFRNIDLLGLDEVRIFEIGKVFKGKEEFWTLGIANSNVKSLKFAGPESSPALNLYSSITSSSPPALNCI
jgi:hypothetical protein